MTVMVTGGIVYDCNGYWGVLYMTVLVTGGYCI